MVQILLFIPMYVCWKYLIEPKFLVQIFTILPFIDGILSKFLHERRESSVKCKSISFAEKIFGNDGQCITKRDICFAVVFVLLLLTDSVVWKISKYTECISFKIMDLEMDCIYMLSAVFILVTGSQYSNLISFFSHCSELILIVSIFWIAQDSFLKLQIDPDTISNAYPASAPSEHGNNDKPEEHPKNIKSENDQLDFTTIHLPD